jgi:hypothetical protein
MSEIKQFLWMSPRRFADMTGIPLSTVYRYVRGGKIQHRRRNGRLWLSPDLHVGDRSPGVVPRQYRDEFGRPLEGVECPRSARLWGTAGANVERSFAVARIAVRAGPDTAVLRDVLDPTGPNVLDPGIACEVEEDAKRGRRDVLLY